MDKTNHLFSKHKKTNAQYFCDKKANTTKKFLSLNLKENPLIAGTLINFFTIVLGAVWLYSVDSFSNAEQYNIFFISFVITEALVFLFSYLKSNMYILLSFCTLSNIGVFIQVIFITSSNNDDVLMFWLKTLVGLFIGAAAAAVLILLCRFITRKGSKLLTYVFLTAITFSVLAITALLILSNKDHKNGASISVAIGSITLGLIELYKLLWLTFTATVFSSFDNVINPRKKFSLILGFTVLCAIMLILCRELGTLVIISGSYALLITLIWDKEYPALCKIIKICILLLLFIMALYVLFLPSIMELLSTKAIDTGNIVLNRFVSWLNPFNKTPSSEQAALAYKSIVNGGLLGGSDSAFYIYAQNHDYTLTAIISRLGIFACIIITALYGIISYNSFSEVNKKIEFSNDKSVENISALLATIILTVNAAFCISSNISLVPLSGVVLPWIARGGTANFISNIFITMILWNCTEKSYKLSITDTCSNKNSKPLERIGG